MTARTTALLLALSLVPAAAARAGEPAAELTHRFALLAGANDGGAGRVALAYARSDAETLSEVLGALGGVPAENRILLLDPTAADLEDAFARLRDLVAAAEAKGGRTEVVFYYSGHSDEQGLLLGGARVPYRQVRADLDGVGADVRIAILDSCASGALTRGKGGARRPPFLVDRSGIVSGYAFLTSASEDEAAQESDTLAGSFFTHYLVSGLRGTADATPDGRVTLNEAYQYAFHETLARTESTRAGPQHPAYDIHLVGSGDVVLTDLRDTAATLELPLEAQGRLFVRDAGRRLVAEVRKTAGAPLQLGLEPGRYQLTWQTPGALRRGELELVDGDRARVDPAAMAPLDREPSTLRGGGFTPVPATFAVWPGISTDALVGGPTVSHLRLDLLASRGGALVGLGVSPGVTWLDGPATGLQVAGLGAWSGDLRGGQVGGLGTQARDVEGAQVAGLYTGASGRLRGLQVAGLAAVAGGDVVGAQLAGGLTLAPEVDGWQIAPVNLAEALSGVQVGVVNAVRHGRGLQVGVVNLADTFDGLPLGLVNVIGDGIFAPTAWTSDQAPVAAGLKSGSRRAYVVVGLALDPWRDRPQLRTVGAVGVHFFGRPFWLDVDAAISSPTLTYDPELAAANGLDLVVSLRGSVGWQLFDHLAVFAGPSLNLLASKVRTSPHPGWTLWARDGAVNLAVWPGFVAGVQL